MIFAQIGENADGIRQWASAMGLTVEAARGDAGLKLARLLVEQGHDPEQPYGTMRGDMPCMMYRSLGEAAGLNVEDPDRGRLRFVKYKPRPGGDE